MLNQELSIENQEPGETRCFASGVTATNMHRSQPRHDQRGLGCQLLPLATAERRTRTSEQDQCKHNLCHLRNLRTREEHRNYRTAGD